MSNLLSVLIVDDNKELVNLMKEYISSINDIEVSGTAYDGHEAIQKIKELKPDIVLLDLVMPGLDGIAVLERLNKENIEKRPIFIVLSAISQDMLVQKAMDFGADYYLVKPFDMQIVVQRIKLIYNMGCNGSISRKREKYLTLSKNLNENENDEYRLNYEISNILHLLGIHTNMKGCQYIKEAVSMVVKNRKEHMLITKIIYPDVAKRYHTTPERVERAIRNAIENMWFKNGSSTLDSMFGVAARGKKKKKPTNSEFIAMIADKVRMNMQIK